MAGGESMIPERLFLAARAVLAEIEALESSIQEEREVNATFGIVEYVTVDGRRLRSIDGLIVEGR